MKMLKNNIWIVLLMITGVNASAGEVGIIRGGIGDTIHAFIKDHPFVTATAFVGVVGGAYILSSEFFSNDPSRTNEQFESNKKLKLENLCELIRDFCKNSEKTKEKAKIIVEEKNKLEQEFGEESVHQHLFENRLFGNFTYIQQIAEGKVEIN